MEGVVLKRWVITYFHPYKHFLKLSFCICALLISTFSISRVCVSEEEFCLSQSNRQIFEFSKKEFLKKQRHFRPGMYGKFFYH